MKTCQVDGLAVQRPQTTPSAPGHPGHQTWQCEISSCGVSSRTMFTTHHFQRHYQNCDSTSTPQSGTSHKTCLGGFGGNGSIVWTSAVSQAGRTSSAFKVTMKLQTFLFQMVVASCISVQYLWKYGFVKSSDNLYALCTCVLQAASISWCVQMYCQWRSSHAFVCYARIMSWRFWVQTESLYMYTGCPRRNVKYFGRVFLMLNYTDITQNTYIQSW